ncbi:MAG: hypothetical protein VZQ55_05610 [Ruminococcus sp.]|nr:hypothetical protein [Ruminococcus sp.]
MKKLNFNTVKKSYFTVTLADEANTTIMIACPTKALVDDLMAFENSLKVVNEEEITDTSMDDLYRTCAKLMSRNKTGKVITKEYLEQIFDIEDINLFYVSYMDFVYEIANSKN